MKKKSKVVLIVLVAILSLGLIVIIGLRVFVGSINNQRTCEWANIDNIEIHAKVDIPKITSSECDYNVETNTKKASFILDKNKLDVDRYLQVNNLNKIDITSNIDYNKFLNLKKKTIESTLLYYKENKFNGENTYVLLDLLASRLWVTIEYRD